MKNDRLNALLGRIKANESISHLVLGSLLVVSVLYATTII
jgi:hypothetical protein